ncbi:MAG: hypothetical protein M3252_02810 [Actinomycetota bacterium]|nr:hypothetical protein [Actinomycetota bacterium]
MTDAITTFDPYHGVPVDSVGTTVEYFDEVTAALADERHYWEWFGGQYQGRQGQGTLPWPSLTASKPFTRSCWQT